MAFWKNLFDNQKGTSASSESSKGYVCSINTKDARAYSSLLNDLEMVIHYIAKNTYGYGEIGVVVIVEKKDNTYCKVSGSLLADCRFCGVNFGDGFRYNGDDNALFDAEFATGFSTFEEVKKEMLLQFNWSDLQVYNTSFTLIDRGEKPFISYNFTVKK